MKKCMEDGVKVIISHLKPYTLLWEKTTMVLGEECVIDLEVPTIAHIGLYDINIFGVDSARNIYLMAKQTQTDHIFKFSREGDFVLAFGHNGGGPGENLGENMVDVHDAEGALFGRVSWDVLHGNTPKSKVVKCGRFCCIREKQSGCKQFVAAKIA